MLTVSDPKNFDWANLSLTDCLEGNAYDAYATIHVFFKLIEKLNDKTPKLMHLMEELVMPAFPMFIEMERKGLHVDLNRLKELDKEIKQDILEKEDSLHFYPQVKDVDNLNSTKDLIKILYTREDGFGLFPPQLTPKEQPSVAADTLKIILAQISELL